MAFRRGDVQRWRRFLLLGVKHKQEGGDSRSSEQQGDVSATAIRESKTQVTETRSSKDTASILSQHENDLVVSCVNDFRSFSALERSLEEKIRLVFDCNRILTAIIYADTPHNRRICQKLVDYGPLRWSGLPSKLQRDREFALSLRRVPVSCARDVFSQFPDLRQHHEFWKRIVDCAEGGSLFELIETFATTDILNEPELVLAACRSEASIVKLLSREGKLLNDRSFVERLLLEKQPLALAHVPPVVLEVFPDIIVSAFAPFARRQDPDRHGSQQARAAATNIARSSILDCRQNVLKWFEAGLPFFSPCVFLSLHSEADIAAMRFSRWKDDREVCTSIAKHCINEHLLQYSFSGAAPTLRNDKKFMLKILAIQPLLLHCVQDRTVWRDHDVLLQAFGRSQPAVTQFLQHGNRLEALQQFYTWVQEQLTVWETFAMTVLLGMHKDFGSTLARLNQGFETSQSYKRCIAEFVGVPMGKDKISLLRQAKTNVEAVL